MSRIKGTALVGVVKTLRTLKGRAEPRLADPLRHYLDERVLLSRWYPEDDFYALLDVMVEIVPDPGEDPWVWVGRQGARSDLLGTYSAFLLPGRPRETLRRAPKIWSLYHDTGESRIEVQGSEAVLSIHEYPHVDDRFVRLQTGYHEEILVLAGAKDPRVEPLGISDGVASWRAAWTEPGAVG